MPVIRKIDDFLPYQGRLGWWLLAGRIMARTWGYAAWHRPSVVGVVAGTLVSVPVLYAGRWRRARGTS